VTVKLIKKPEEQAPPKQVHLAIGCPMYDGRVALPFFSSIVNFVMEVSKKHNVDFHFCTGESILPKARNIIVHQMLANKETTHLLFVDSDIGFDGRDIDLMIQADKPIMVAPVQLKIPNKEIFNIDVIKTEKAQTRYTPFKVKRGGTGLMLIQREVFEKLKPHVQTYTSVNMSTKKEEKQYAFFNYDVNGVDFTGEDYYFCNAWTKLGGEIWCAPWVKYQHISNYHVYDKMYPVEVEESNNFDRNI